MAIAETCVDVICVCPLEQGNVDKAMDMARGREGDTGFGVMKVVEALVQQGHTERALEFFKSVISAERKQYTKSLALIATAMVKEGKIMILLNVSVSGSGSAVAKLAIFNFR